MVKTKTWEKKQLHKTRIYHENNFTRCVFEGFELE